MATTLPYYQCSICPSAGDNDISTFLSWRCSYCHLPVVGVDAKFNWFVQNQLMVDSRDLKH